MAVELFGHGRAITLLSVHPGPIRNGRAREVPAESPTPWDLLRLGWGLQKSGGRRDRICPSPKQNAKCALLQSVLPAPTHHTGQHQRPSLSVSRSWCYAKVVLGVMKKSASETFGLCVSFGKFYRCRAGTVDSVDV